MPWPNAQRGFAALAYINSAAAAAAVAAATTAPVSVHVTAPAA